MIRSQLGPSLHLRGFPESQGLHQLDVVPVVAVDPGQTRLPDLHQLLLAELARVGRAVVVKSEIISLTYLHIYN